MNIPQMIKLTERWAVENSPALLSGAAVAGVVGTAWLTGKASIKAYEIVLEEEKVWRLEGEIPLKHKINLVWKEFIPPVLLGAGTIAAVVGSNRIGTRRATALAAAYQLSVQGFESYKEKVVEQLGRQKEENVRAAVAQEREDREPIKAKDIVYVGNGDVLFYDELTGRSFMSTMETVKKAQNDVNYRIINHMYASLGDFYSRVGLAGTQLGETLGWTTDNLCELEFSSFITEDSKPAITVSFHNKPIPKYYKIDH